MNKDSILKNIGLGAVFYYSIVLVVYTIVNPSVKAIFLFGFVILVFSLLWILGFAIESLVEIFKMLKKEVDEK